MREVCGEEHVAVGMTYLGGEKRAGHLVGDAHVAIGSRWRSVYPFLVEEAVPNG